MNRKNIIKCAMNNKGAAFAVICLALHFCILLIAGLQGAYEFLGTIGVIGLMLISIMHLNLCAIGIAAIYGAYVVWDWNLLCSLILAFPAYALIIFGGLTYVMSNLLETITSSFSKKEGGSNESRKKI